MKIKRLYEGVIKSERYCVIDKSDNHVIFEGDVNTCLYLYGKYDKEGRTPYIEKRTRELLSVGDIQLLIQSNKYNL